MFVCLNLAMSIDGKITSAAREPPRFTSGQDREHMDELRATADAVLMGARTLREDDPHFIVRSREVMARRKHSTGRLEQPWSIVLSRRAAVPLQRRFFSDPTPRRIVVATQAAPQEALDKLQGRCDIWRLGTQRVVIRELLARLAEAGVKRLLVEGGGEVAWQFLNAQAVDELYLTLAPCLLGGRTAPTPVGGPGWSMQQRCNLQLREARVVGDEIFCRYGFASVSPGVPAWTVRPHRG
jgi:riboflavin-specific deaminase-like protein